MRFQIPPGQSGARRAALAACLAWVGAGLLTGCATPRAAPQFFPPVASGRFCAIAQQRMSSTQLPVQNVVHPDYDGFVKSKPVVRPLETEEYHWYDDAADTELRMISCKMKTVDHLKAEYGPAAAGEESSCAALNAVILEGVLASFSAPQRRRLRFDQGRAVVFDPDRLTNDGPLWLAPFAIVATTPDGKLHVATKAMRNDWTDPRLQAAPVRFRGTRYCHLIAPEYLRRVLLGEVPVAAR